MLQLHPVPASGWINTDFTQEERDVLLKSGMMPVNDVFYPYVDNVSKILLLYGGYGSGKSDFIAARYIRKIRTAKYFKLYFGRNVEGDARDSCHSKLISIIERHGLQQEFKYSKEPTGTMVITHIATGNKMLPYGASDSQGLKSVDDPTDIWMEESDQFSAEDMAILLSRLRTPKAPHQLVLSFNTAPVTPGHWIVKYFFPENSLDGEATLNEDVVSALSAIEITKIFCNYTDNFFINQEEYYNTLRFLSNGDPAMLAAMAAGAWGIIVVGARFWKGFSQSRQLVNDVYRPEYPLHITWDENVNPFLTCLVWQIIGKRAVQIDEICLEDPHNRVKDVCAEFIKRYPVTLCKGLFVYGDRTSIKEDTKLEKGENFFTKILEWLKSYRPQLRMQSVNPSIVQSAGFVNAVYEGLIPELFFGVNPKCKRSVFDYQYAPEDSDGTLKKTTRRNKDTGVTYEIYGHPSDAKRYILTQAFNTEYLKYLSLHKNTNASRLLSGAR